ncbi:hypothetical protein GCM10008904_32590 [Paraclostridium ghonii]|uniref:DUF4355 domain-containing protein n=1 Tax=Paraclostridium ghonii TaxID=29358 RepID=A0ABU0MXU4_9FIRM|nr:DUF4355 domain-containing protein [Paeniclostridium ghonii]MDQ0555336.1 hypothetical protein [Paeniclostridium ghonii]
MRSWKGENMKKSELLKLIENIEEDVDLVEIKEVKSWLDSEKDKHSQKSIKTALDNFKKNDMQKLIDAELLKRNPAKTPEQLKIEELEAKFATIEKEKNRAEMTAKFKDTLIEKNIPSKMIDFLLADDDEVTNANISLFEESMKSYIDKNVEDRVSNTSYTPPSGNSTGNLYEDLLNSVDNMSTEQVMEMLNKF